VLLEVFVFNGNDCVPQDFGKIIVRSQDAPLQRKGADDLALIVIQLGDGTGAVVLQFADLRQVGGIDNQKTGQSSHQGRGQQQQAEDDPADQLSPTHMHSG